MKAMQRLHTISAGQPFLLTLALRLLAEAGGDAALLTRTLILLPNRRACRSLREAFLEASGGKPLLLPKIQPIGEVDGEQALFGDISTNLSQIEALPPVISPVRRHFLLMGLVMEFEHARSGRRHHVDQAAHLARQLARFIDDVAVSNLSFDNLAALVPEDLATHWQQTLDFLNIISHRWPEILKSEGAIEPVTHRIALLSAVRKSWQQNPPDYPVIAAGSTGSQPVTADLLAAIAKLPQGQVILPALDTHMPEDQWQSLSETHPQFVMKQLLKRMGVEREEVLEIGVVTPRERCLQTMLQPPESTSHWREEKLPFAEGMQGISLLTAETQLEEARLIAIRMREALETPAQTAALITQDRTLARMVASQMQRFGVAIDDSAGRPLGEIPAAAFLKLTADMIATRAAPASLLALLRHPFAAFGLETAQCRLLSRQLELSLLRGVRRAPGLDALLYALRGLPEKIPALEDLLIQMSEIARPFAQYFEQKKAISLSELLRAHMAFAEAAATTHETPGSDRLWAGEDGNQLAAHLAELAAHADILRDVDPISYPALFETLLADASYWPRFGLHPRLHILSPIEARLQRFDVVILGGLNEGSWPALPSADPWMSRPMRGNFGLPVSERTIGQSAHDIYMLCAAPQVVLTRARKQNGAPSVPSRWLVRMETLLAGRAPELLAQMQVSAHYVPALAMLDAPLDMQQLNRPAPCPPLAARPRQMRVTAIDTWLRDPYMIYANYILRLRALDPLDKEPGAADFGNLVHKALEIFTRNYPKDLPANAYDELLKSGREAFDEMLDRPAVATLWWPRYEAMAAWLLEQEAARRGGLAQVISEVVGQWKFEVDGKPFTLNTRIDRLEVRHDKFARVIDYKTGTMPSPGDIAKGAANQLPLEALIALHGSLEPAMSGITHIESLEYWKLAGNSEHCEIVEISASVLDAAHLRLESLIRQFDNAAMPYEAQNNPALLPRYNDFAHLTRRQEWEAV